MTASKDSFSIDLVLRHPTHNPQSISAALSLEPKACWPVGENLGRVRAKWSFFYARLLEGVASSEYGRAMKKVSRFLRKNAAFWADFTDGNGEVELILNQTMTPQEKEGEDCFELYLAPAFLQDLSTRGIGLRVQGWQGRVKKVKSAGSLKSAQDSIGRYRVSAVRGTQGSFDCGFASLIAKQNPRSG